MIFIPAHRKFSVDAMLRPSLTTEFAPAWSLWVLRAQMGLVYFFGGIAKLNGDWLARLAPAHLDAAGSQFAGAVEVPRPGLAGAGL